MLLRFTKMHGLGNDFVMLDLLTQRFKLRPRHIRHLADRHTGVGCDQVLVVEAPRDPDIDFRYRIYNADGSEVEHCGNGARCFARFVREKRLTTQKDIRVETLGGVLQLTVQDDDRVKVLMGVPQLEPAEVPFTADSRQTHYSVDVSGQTLSLGAVSMGNPHAVLRVDDVQHCDLETLGPALESHPGFPSRVNVGFMEVVSEREIRLRVFERGVGETLACGSGACAAVVHGIEAGWLARAVTVHLPGGMLEVAWAGEGEQVVMTGPTTQVYEGNIKL